MREGTSNNRVQKRKERDAKKKEEREDMIRKGNAKTWNQPRQMGKRRGGAVGTSCTEYFSFKNGHLIIVYF